MKVERAGVKKVRERFLKKTLIRVVDAHECVLCIYGARVSA